jgi:hypothetical protein
VRSFRLAVCLTLGMAGHLVACGTGRSGNDGSSSTGSGPVADAGTNPGGADAGMGAGTGSDAGNPAGGADGGSATTTRHTLDIRVSGSGAVQGAPSACRTTCQQQLDEGQTVHLVAGADNGWKFDGWQGACTGSSVCDLTITADTSVTATFTQLPPPPADRCAGLMPASLPPPVVPNLTCNGGCTAGTSDDGTGNFALKWRTDPSYGGMAWSVFQMENGQAVFKKMLMASDQSWLLLFSEPSGFTLADIGFDGNSIYTYTNSGQLISDDGVGGAGDGAAVASDPSGGFSAVMWQSGPQVGAVSYTFKRFDKAGAPLTGETLVFSGSTYHSLRATGMTLSHDTMVILEYTDSNADAFTGLWIGPDGAAMGSPFRVASGGPLQFLLDGSLLQHSGNQFTVWPDGASSPSPTPGWLAARGNAQWLYAIRGGAGYAMAGTCNGIEVLAKDGTSCGCLAVPGLSPNTSVGRDGSLIVPLGESYALYPLLFH